MWWACDGVFDDNECQQRFKHKSSMKKVEKKRTKYIVFLIRM